MSGIVCPIRGGPDSQPTVRLAIATARSTGLPLHFLYVVNMDFLLRTSHSRMQTLAKELQQMGEFILLTAQSAAANAGVDAEGDVREGDVGEEIINLCLEIDAGYVVLGRPQARTGEDVFPLEMLPAFARRIEQETGAEVIFAQGDGA